MSTNRKRKYGPIRAGAETSAGTSDDVFDKFFGPSAEPPPASLPESSSLPEIAPTKASSLPSEADLAPQKTSLPEISSLPDSTGSNDESLNLMASLPDVSGYTKLWHQMTDHLYCQLTTTEQAVHIQLFRLSWGYGSPTCTIGLPRLSKRVGAAPSTIQKAVEGLIHKGLIKKLRTIQGKGKLQGIEYEVTPPPSLLKSGSLPKSTSLPDSGINKEEHKKNDKKDATLCPECEKTGGFLYPNGFDGGGVVKCKHEPSR